MSKKSTSRFNYRLILRGTLLYGSIFLLASLAGNLWMSRDQYTGPVPDLVGEALDGRIQRVSFFSPDAPRVLYFFAEWCPICKLQHSVISSVNEREPVLGIAMQSGSTHEVARYVEQQEFEFEVINDAAGDISGRFGVNGVPAVFVIDSNGQIRYSTRGYTSWMGLMTRIWLAEE